LSEIAGTTGLSEGTVKAHLSRGVAKATIGTWGAGGPALSRFLLMGLPMIPKPIKPILLVIAGTFLPHHKRYAAAISFTATAAAFLRLSALL
jgi:hypothetical protein